MTAAARSGGAGRRAPLPARAGPAGVRGAIGVPIPCQCVRLASRELRNPPSSCRTFVLRGGSEADCL